MISFIIHAGYEGSDHCTHKNAITRELKFVLILLPIYRKSTSSNVNYLFICILSVITGYIKDTCSNKLNVLQNLNLLQLLKFMA